MNNSCRGESADCSSTAVMIMNNSDFMRRVRHVIKEHGRLGKDVESLPEDTDLSQAGLTSHASVNIMLALEAEFGIEFPDAMLRRNIFNSLSTIRTALEEL